MQFIRKCFLISISIGVSLLFITCSKDPIVNPQIALTFDDGPDSLYTPKILDILKEKHVTATFFLIGIHVQAYPKIVERIKREGHTIGNHSYSHIYMPTATFPVILDEIQRTQHLMDSLTGGLPYKIFRAPWGLINEEQKQQIRDNGYTVIGWNNDPRDYDIATNTPSSIVKNVLAARANNGIVLLHSTDYSGVQSRQNTVDALPQIIDALRDKYHYSFVSVNVLAN